MVDSKHNISLNIKEGGLNTRNIFKKGLKNQPLVSVITSVFNGGKKLEEAILSVINQTYPFVEYIIIDGGSSDGTVDIIFSRGDVIDHYVSEPDKGIYFAMNKGANIARGEYLSFLNASDIYYPKTLDLIVSVIKKKNIDYISAPVDIVNSSEKILSTLHPIKNFKYKEGSYMQMPAPHMSVFLKKNIFHELGGYDLSFKLTSTNPSLTMEHLSLSIVISWSEMFGRIFKCSNLSSSRWCGILLSSNG